MLASSFFILAIITIGIFYWGTNQNKTALTIYSVWLLFTGVLSYNHFFENTESIPPRIAFAVVPNFFFIYFLFKKINIENINISILTALHIVRIPVELTLLQLYFDKKVPLLMTFEGYNFDILSGISALLLLFFMPKISFSFLKIWNFACIILLFIIVTLAILSAKSPFQVLALEQPNVAILEFPFTFLAAIIVPLVLLSHLLVLKKINFIQKK